jgi:hypothetical protein
MKWKILAIGMINYKNYEICPKCILEYGWIPLTLGVSDYDVLDRRECVVIPAVQDRVPRTWPNFVY